MSHAKEYNNYQTRIPRFKCAKGEARCRPRRPPPAVPLAAYGLNEPSSPDLPYTVQSGSYTIHQSDYPREIPEKSARNSGKNETIQRDELFIHDTSSSEDQMVKRLQALIT